MALLATRRERFSLRGLVDSTYLDGKPVACLTVWDGGTLAALQTSRTAVSGRLGGGLRGRVGPFNRAMRRRMLRGLARIRQDAGRPLFVSLTYPGAYPTAEAAKRHLFRFLRALTRRHPKLSGVWRLGFQERDGGVPHFHTVMWGVDYLNLAMVSALWVSTADADLMGRLSGEDREAWVKRGVDVTRARSARTAGGYCAKYAAKSDPEPGPLWCGRRWGWFNRENLPLAAAVGYAIWEAHLFYDVRRVMRRLSRRRRLSGRSGITIFCGYPQDLRRLL